MSARLSGTCLSAGAYFYLRRQLAAGQVMGPVVVVVVVVLVDFKTFTHISSKISCSDFTFKIVFRVGSLEILGSNPEESFIHEVSTYV